MLRILVKYSLIGLLVLASLFWLSLLVITEPDDWGPGAIPSFILAGCVLDGALLSIKRGNLGGTIVLVCGVLFGLNFILALVYSWWYFGTDSSGGWFVLLIGVGFSVIGAALRWLDRRPSASITSVT